LKPARVLVLFAHPALEKSRVHRKLAGAVQQVQGAALHDLYQVYPDFHIDVRREQDLLREHDVLVFQYPLLWYNVPSLLREWQDLVLEHGWAYGQNGDALRGKRFMNAVSTGGPEEAYRKGPHGGFSLRELLAPTEQMARVCGMEFLPPFAVHGTFQMPEARILRHALDYRRTLEALRDGRIDPAAVRGLSRINDQELDAVLRS